MRIQHKMRQKDQLIIPTSIGEDFIKILHEKNVHPGIHQLKSAMGKSFAIKKLDD